MRFVTKIIAFIEMNVVIKEWRKQIVIYTLMEVSNFFI